MNYNISLGIAKKTSIFY